MLKFKLNPVNNKLFELLQEMKSSKLYKLYITLSSKLQTDNIIVA